jgi:capsular polysaccharide transport system permease protein
VGLPLALAALYYFSVAADQYVAEFRFALRSVEPVRNEASAIFQGSVASSPIGVDSYAIVQYLASRDIVDELSKTIDLREMFSRPEADWLVRLQLPVSIEELVRYWKKPGGRVFRCHKRDNRGQGSSLHPRGRVQIGARGPRLIGTLGE